MCHECLQNFFHNKITVIREELCATSSAIPTENTSSEVLVASSEPEVHFSNFRIVSPVEVRNIIMKAPSKSCSLDPIPTWHLKNSIDEVLPTLTHLINASLAESSMPSSLKNAIVTPLLKKPALEPEELKNYRPVSNLPYVSKLIECALSAQLNEHMLKNSMYEIFQSAYRKAHSTETALTRVQNDILCSLDDKNCVLLLLLDLSSAFDTIDYSVLLSRLFTYIGVCGDALSWFKSYHSDRYQSVRCLHSVSGKQPLQTSVPQGSGLGPQLFCIYTLPLGEIMRRHGVEFHFFADDTNIYMSTSFPDLAAACTRIEHCISDIKSWMSSNFLKFNDDKTEMLLIRSRFSRGDLCSFSVDISKSQKHRCTVRL